MYKRKNGDADISFLDFVSSTQHLVLFGRQRKPGRCRVEAQSFAQTSINVWQLRQKVQSDLLLSYNIIDLLLRCAIGFGVGK